MFKKLRLIWRALCMPGVVGVDDAMYLGAAALTTAGGMYSANQANQTSAGNAYTANMTNMFMQAQNQGYNSAEAAASRQFNSDQAGITRDWQQGQREQAQQFTADETQRARNFNQMMAEGTNQFNAAEAQKNRDYQTQMSGSAYQRAIEDMKKAGLNPMLAYSQGGASTPSGSSASGVSASSPAGSSSAGGGATAGGATASSGGWAGAKTPNYMPIPVDSIMSSALDLEAKAAAIKKTNTESEVLSTAIPINRLEASKREQDYKEQKYSFEDRMRNIQLDVSQKNISNRMAVELENVRKDMEKTDLLLKQGHIDEAAAKTRALNANARLDELGVPKAEAEARWAEKTGIAGPALNTVGQAAGTAAKIGILGRTLGH